MADIVCSARLVLSYTEKKRGSRVAEDGPIDRDVARKWKLLVDGMLEPQFGNLVWIVLWKGECMGVA
jgi:hypothetical protein